MHVYTKSFSFPFNMQYTTSKYLSKQSTKCYFHDILYTITFKRHSMVRFTRPDLLLRPYTLHKRMIFISFLYSIFFTQLIKVEILNLVNLCKVILILYLSKLVILPSFLTKVHCHSFQIILSSPMTKQHFLFPFLTLFQHY